MMLPKKNRKYSSQRNVIKMSGSHFPRYRFAYVRYVRKTFQTIQEPGIFMTFSVTGKDKPIPIPLLNRNLNLNPTLTLLPSFRPATTITNEYKSRKILVAENKINVIFMAFHRYFLVLFSSYYIWDRVLLLSLLPPFDTLPCNILVDRHFCSCVIIVGRDPFRSRRSSSKMQLMNRRRTTNKYYLIERRIR